MIIIQFPQYRVNLCLPDIKGPWNYHPILSLYHGTTTEGFKTSMSSNKKIIVLSKETNSPVHKFLTDYYRLYYFLQKN